MAIPGVPRGRRDRTRLTGRLAGTAPSSGAGRPVDESGFRRRPAAGDTAGLTIGAERP